MAKLAIFVAAARLTQAYTNVDVSQFMMKNIDPIVMPGEYKSHMHSFFGADAVTVNLPTSDQLRNSCATANNPNDLSVYWIPTLYYTGDGAYTAVKPKRFTAYYQFEKSEAAEVPIPENFNVLAGNAKATTVADLDKGANIAWLCEKEKFDAGGKEYSDFPTSGCKVMQTVVWFPDCVNEKTLESGYTRTNGGSCPDGMKTMPQLRFSIRYDVSSVAPDGWSGAAPFELACGPSHCMHGDFINGWDQEANKNMQALNKPNSFQTLEGSLGKSKDGASGCTAADQDPDNGTDDYETSLDMMGEGSSEGTPATTTSATSTAPIATQEPTTAKSTVSATPTAAAAADAAELTGESTKEAVVSALPETFTITTFIAWLQEQTESSSVKARRHARNFIS